MTDRNTTEMDQPAVAAPALAMSAHDRQVLRGLAARVAELAAREGEAAKRELWLRHNALKPTRPLVVCSPENAWNEILPPEVIECEDAMARGWETQLRQQIFWGERMGDDTPIEPVFMVYAIAHESGWGVQELRHESGLAGGSYSWEAPIREWADMERLRPCEVRIDEEATRGIFELAGEVFDGLLEVRYGGY